MKSVIKTKLYNQDGSSLSFVLIIGLILMLLVASLIAVANSNLSFTQESVESRQGYIDAKSVIEFGKVEISSRITKLKDKEEQIGKETDTARLATLKNERTALITALAATFSVYGVVEDVTGNLVPDSLSFSAGSYNGSTRKVLGVCTVTPTTLSSGVTKFAFDLETQNLRRALNYKIDFNYAAKSVSYWHSTSVVPVPKPNDATIGTWIKTNINKTESWLLGLVTRSVFVKTVNPSYTYETAYLTALTVLLEVTLNANDAKIAGMSLNVGKDDAGFGWPESGLLGLPASINLNLKAKNLYFSDPLPTSAKNATFNMTAENIIFPGDLIIGDGQTLNLTCDNLWVGGNIVLGYQSELTVTGTAGKTANQMVVGGSIIKTGLTDGSHRGDVNISNLYYFEAGGLDIDNNQNNDFKIAAKTVLIKGNMTIEGKGWSDTMVSAITSPVQITTQYFECTGKTTIARYGNPSTPIAITADSGVLNVRFTGGYDQQYAHVDIDGSSTVVFGKSFYLRSNGIDYMSRIVWSHLYVEGGDVYIEGSADNSIQMSDQSFLYGISAGKSAIKIYNQTKINYLGSNVTVAPGSYNTRVEYISSNNNTYYAGILIPSYLTRFGDYPASAAGTAEVGVEKYY